MSFLEHIMWNILRKVDEDMHKIPVAHLIDMTKKKWVSLTGEGSHQKLTSHNPQQQLSLCNSTHISSRIKNNS